MWFLEGDVLELQFRELCTSRILLNVDWCWQPASSLSTAQFIRCLRTRPRPYYFSDVVVWS